MNWEYMFCLSMVWYIINIALISSTQIAHTSTKTDISINRMGWSHHLFSHDVNFVTDLLIISSVIDGKFDPFINVTYLAVCVCN